MRIHVTPASCGSLLRHLRSRPDTFAEHVAPDEIEASLSGFGSVEAMRLELSLRIRGWESASRNRFARAEIVDTLRTVPAGAWGSSSSYATAGLVTAA